MVPKKVLGDTISRGNIISTNILKDGSVVVGFNAYSGERYYKYDAIAGAAILAGADPKNFSGDEVSGPDGGVGFADIAEDVAETAAEL